MHLKYIVCRVSDPLRSEFSVAQTQWGVLSSAPGFLGQLAGWDMKSESHACILGIWQDEEHYKNFMALQHDEILQANEQGKTYESINVSQLEPIYPMPGSSSEMVGCLQEARFIRSADCVVKPEQTEHFLEAQQTVWIPNMGTAEGMLAGCFTKVKGRSDRYIVISLWTSRELHDAYSRDKLPQLREQSRVSEDVERITGRLISLEQDWLVLPAE